MESAPEDSSLAIAHRTPGVRRLHATPQEPAIAVRRVRIVNRGERSPPAAPVRRDDSRRALQPLFDQADRLFACRFATGARMMPVIDPSFVRRADAAVRLPELVSTRGRQLAYSVAFHQEMRQRQFEPNLATVRALRRRPFALDAYLWDAGYADQASPARSRLGVYHGLADQPLRTPGVSDVLAFERELASVRETLRRLEQSPDPACQV